MKFRLCAARIVLRCVQRLTNGLLISCRWATALSRGWWYEGVDSEKKTVKWMDKRSPVMWKLNSPRVLSLALGRAIRFFKYHIFHTTSVNNDSCLSYGESKSMSGNAYLHGVIPWIEIHKSETGIITEHLNVQVVMVYERFIEHCYFFVFKIAMVLIISQLCVSIELWCFESRSVYVFACARKIYRVLLIFAFEVAMILIISQFCVPVEIRHFAVTSSKSRSYHRISNAFEFKISAAFLWRYHRVLT